MYNEFYLFCYTGTAAPIRYMPPESIRRRQWSMQSDVWAFGVVCWEIFSNGEYPYFTVASDEAVAERVVSENLRLTIPEGCPKDVFDLMQGCWATGRT